MERNGGKVSIWAYATLAVKAEINTEGEVKRNENVVVRCEKQRGKGC